MEDVKVLKKGTYKGFKYAILQIIYENGIEGHINGYVRIPKGNILFEIGSYDDMPISVHGGLTYSSSHLSGVEKDTKNVIWIGFDTAHAGDWYPGSPNNADHKWTVKEVEAECKSMIEQTKKITWKKAIEKKLKYEPDWFKNSIKILSKESSK